MTHPLPRRRFLRDVGRGTLVSMLGSSLALDLDLISKSFGSGINTSARGSIRLHALLSGLGKSPAMVTIHGTCLRNLSPLGIISLERSVRILRHC